MLIARGSVLAVDLLQYSSQCWAQLTLYLRSMIPATNASEMSGNVP